MSESELSIKLEKLRLLEAKKRLEDGLPHLYGFPWYKWAKEFFLSRDRINLLLAGNQLSKSSTQIRKCIHWATNQELWGSLWNHRPRQFWYMYPSSKQVKIEYETKWQQFLPQNEYRNSPQYGWKPEFKNGELISIKFNSGVNIYFKTYTQSSVALQSATVDAVFADEEMPDDLYPEIIMRLTASRGYFHMVFTATLGQDFWRRVMEPEEHEEELLPEAKKWRVGMYDCQVYADGTLTQWTEEYIQMIKNRCGSEEEILKRVYGRFIMDKGGKKYHQFDLKKHIRPIPGPIPDDWSIYEGIDVGSGSVLGRKEGHPAAICFIAVNKEHTFGRVVFGWRGDGIKTTAGDVFNKHIELKKELGRNVTLQFYDHASADFKTIADSNGEPFIPAEKSHEIGEQILNTLFKNNMLFLDDTEEIRKLGIELAHIRKDVAKQHCRDDFADALRYGVTKIPWDWSSIKGSRPEGIVENSKQVLTPEQISILERRKDFFGKEGTFDSSWSVMEEIEEANELYG